MKLPFQFILIGILFCFFFNAQAQVPGCTDPQANNYNASATINNGSCTYNATSLPLIDKTNLQTPLLNESSGLTFLDGKLWSFSDSGNPNDIYRIDTVTNTIFQTVDISNATNVDWEDMTSSSNYLFVGDFGNNNGNRQDLKIYRINKSALTPTTTSVTASIINFSFSDQTSFVSNPTNHNFDCEAMIFLNDSIHLFSKNWVDFQTKHYVLPNSPGTHVAQLRETLNTGFLVTGASVQQYGVISLIGYLKTGTKAVSLYMLYDYKNNLLFNGNKRKFDLSTQNVYGQVEGVEFFNNSLAFVSNELYTSGANVPAKLRTFNLAAYLPGAFLFPKPTANFTVNNAAICQNVTAIFTDQSLNSPTSWQWSFPGGTPSSSTLQHPQVQYSNSGLYSVTLIAGNGAGFDTIVKSNYMYVSPLPSSSISAVGPTTVCSGGSVLLNANTGAGLSYQWKINNVDILGAINSSFVANATGNYTCLVSNSCGSVASNVVAVLVEDVPADPVLPSGPTIACINSNNQIYSVSPVNGATSYQWSVPSGALITSGQGTSMISVEYSNSAVSGDVCVFAMNSCGSSTDHCMAITVFNSIPAKPLSITGNTLPCPGVSGIVYSCPVVLNASSYLWTVPSSAIIVNGQGTNTILVNFLSNFTSGSIKVAAVNCLGSSLFKTLSVRGKPSTPALISGLSEEVCAGTTNVSYSIAPVTGAIGYSWTLPANTTLVSGQGTTSITLNFSASFKSGTLKVAASNSCGTSGLKSLTIRSTPRTPDLISGATSVCANQLGVVYSIPAVTGALSYTWNVPVGASFTGQTTPAISVDFGLVAGIVKVKANNNCGSSAFRTLSVSTVCREGADVFGFNPTIYPNPSSTQFILKVNAEVDSEVSVVLFDLAGREMERVSKLNTDEGFRFGENLKAGVYLAVIISNGERQTLKVIKQE
jgi:PKD repeat protein